MRLDRILTLYLFSPFKRLTSPVSGIEIPILMYHSIANDIESHVHPYFQTITSPKTFEKHLASLKQWGFDVLTLSEAVQLLRSENLPTTSLKVTRAINSRKRRVVITFDDGFRDFYTDAFPILEKYGYKSTVFLTTDFIENNFVTGRECLRVSEIQELAAKGIEFGSHTVSHPQLRNLSYEEVVHEVGHSKTIIENITGAEMTLFSYPYRFPEENTKFTGTLSNILSAQGYTAGVTTIIGQGKACDLPFFLKRLPLNDFDDVDFLWAKLQGGYDWLHTAQLMYKKLRGLVLSSNGMKSMKTKPFIS